MGRRQPAPADLLDRAKAGDAMALDRLFARELPPLRHWAAGRLPAWARDIADTTDLVQETMVQALKHLHRFEYRGEGALQAYLRQAVMNRVRNEIRSRLARGLHVPIDANIHDQGHRRSMPPSRHRCWSATIAAWKGFSPRNARP